MIRLRTIVFLLAFVSIHIGAFSQTEAQIKALINKAAQQITSLQCDFTQTKTLKMLNDKMVSTGKMYYQQGGLLRWEYIKPYHYIFVINGTKVTIKNSKRSDVIDINQSKMFKEIARIMMNSVVGKCVNDSKDFKTSISTTSAEWVATLVPQKSEMRRLFQKIVIHFNRQRKMVAQVDMHEKKGDMTIITLKNVQLNKAINKDVFSVR